MEVLKNPLKFHEFLDARADPRVKDWLGMSSPFPTMALSLAYVVIVKVNK